MPDPGEPTIPEATVMHGSLNHEQGAHMLRNNSIDWWNCRWCRIQKVQMQSGYWLCQCDVPDMYK